MKKIILPGLFALIAIVLMTAIYIVNKPSEKEKHSPSQAGSAFLYWSMARTFPDGKFHTEKYTEAIAQMRISAQFRDDRSPTWEAIGPKNIGGRTLCLAVNPLDTNILWLGSASGGIWKSTTAGRGTSVPWIDAGRSTSRHGSRTQSTAFDRSRPADANVGRRRDGR